MAIFVVHLYRRGQLDTHNVPMAEISVKTSNASFISCVMEMTDTCTTYNLIEDCKWFTFSSDDSKHLIFPLKSNL